MVALPSNANGSDGGFLKSFPEGEVSISCVPAKALCKNAFWWRCTHALVHICVYVYASACAIYSPEELLTFELRDFENITAQKL